MATATINLERLLESLRKELNQNILPYWANKMQDEVFGGFYGRRDGFDALEEKADKAIILNTRILWTFSHALRLSDNAAALTSYRAMADRAYRYICQHFIDPDYGGVYWQLNYQGKPVNTKKQIYAQAFAIYAFSEYHMATGNGEALVKANELFELIEKYSFDPIHNGYLEAFDQQWKVMDDLRLSEKDANEKKTMNTHLHVLEAYTNLYRCTKEPVLEKQLRNLIQVFLDKIIDKKNHFQLFFDEQWNVKSNIVSFGHDIEGSWLLQEAAEVLGDNDLIHVTRKRAVEMVEVTCQEGMDTDGGLMNERHGDGSLDRNKHWWPQAEALVGLVNAWQITGDHRYLEYTEQIWNFIDDHLIDREDGEWYWMVNATGEVIRSEDKAGPWKCPYHNGRAIMELLHRLK